MINLQTFGCKYGTPLPSPGHLRFTAHPEEERSIPHLYPHVSRGPVKHLPGPPNQTSGSSSVMPYLFALVSSVAGPVVQQHGRAKMVPFSFSLEGREGCPLYPVCPPRSPPTTNQPSQSQSNGRGPRASGQSAESLFWLARPSHQRFLSFDLILCELLCPPPTRPRANFRSFIRLITHTHSVGPSLWFLSSLQNLKINTRKKRRNNKNPPPVNPNPSSR